MQTENILFLVNLLDVGKRHSNTSQYAMPVKQEMTIMNTLGTILNYIGATAFLILFVGMAGPIFLILLAGLLVISPFIIVVYFISILVTVKDSAPSEFAQASTTRIGHIKEVNVGDFVQSTSYFNTFGEARGVVVSKWEDADNWYFTIGTKIHTYPKWAGGKILIGG
jgi:hypothetical protein